MVRHRGTPALTLRLSSSVLASLYVLAVPVFVCVDLCASVGTHSCVRFPRGLDAVGTQASLPDGDQLRDIAGVAVLIADADAQPVVTGLEILESDRERLFA